MVVTEIRTPTRAPHLAEVSASIPAMPAKKPTIQDRASGFQNAGRTLSGDIEADNISRGLARRLLVDAEVGHCWAGIQQLQHFGRGLGWGDQAYVKHRPAPLGRGLLIAWAFTQFYRAGRARLSGPLSRLAGPVRRRSLRRGAVENPLDLREETFGCFGSES